MLQIGGNLTQLAFAIYSFRLFAVAHDVDVRAIIIPTILTVVLFIVLAAPIGFFKIWRDAIKNAEKSAEVAS